MGAHPPSQTRWRIPPHPNHSTSPHPLSYLPSPPQEAVGEAGAVCIQIVVNVAADSLCYLQSCAFLQLA